MLHEWNYNLSLKEEQVNGVAMCFVEEVKEAHVPGEMRQRPSLAWVILTQSLFPISMSQEMNDVVAIWTDAEGDA